MKRPRAPWRSRASLAAGLALGLLLAFPAIAQEDEPKPQREGFFGFIPSFGFGFHIYSRDVTGTVGSKFVPQIGPDGQVVLDSFGNPAPLFGEARWRNPALPQNPDCPPGFTNCLPDVFFVAAAPGTERPCTPPEGGIFGIEEVLPGPGYCNFGNRSTEAVDGYALPLTGQILSPAWEGAPLRLRPRAFVQGGFAFPFEQRTIAKDGFKPADFAAVGGEPGFRIQLKGEPQAIWWAGLGIALQLPIDLYPVRFKTSVNYMVEHVDAIGRIDQDQGETIATRRTSRGMRIQSVTPMVGLEVDFARWGPIAVGVSGDVFISVALAGQDKYFTLAAPGLPRVGRPNQQSGIGTFNYEADDLHIFGGASLKFSWVGFQR